MPVKNAPVQAGTSMREAMKRNKQSCAAMGELSGRRGGWSWTAGESRRHRRQEISVLIAGNQRISTPNCFEIRSATCQLREAVSPSRLYDPVVQDSFPNLATSDEAATLLSRYIVLLYTRSIHVLCRAGFFMAEKFTRSGTDVSCRE